ncbi:MAG: hypothetical protein IKD70_05270 [Eggerthellaceae bacterium]|nr:hypothetical protein [Eggerthellaceae bacterium]
MKEERLVEALDARLPDDAARARMWAAIESGMAAEREAAGKTEVREAETADEKPVFTVIRGEGTPSKRRSRGFSWRIPAAAAVLAIAIGAGVLYVTHNPAEPGPGPGPVGPDIVIPDDPTPGDPGNPDVPGGPDAPSDVARTVVTWEGAEYRCVSDEPVDAAVVGDRLGEAEARLDGAGSPRKAEVFAAKGRYATGSYLVVELDGAKYLFMRS